MANQVDFKKVVTTGLESSPFASSLAGLRAHEARYFWNKYKHVFTTIPAVDDQKTLEWVEKVVAERELKFTSSPLEIASFELDGIKFAYVFYENGLAINVMYGLEDGSKRAVGFKLAEGMEIPDEFIGKFKFARQKSALAGVIRGSYFVIKGEY